LVWPNYEIIRLIENQKKLIYINLSYHPNKNHDVPFCKILENSLIKHGNTVEYLRIINNEPFTKILLYFVNLKVLILECHYNFRWDYLKNLSLPSLQILRASWFHSKL